MRWLDRSIRSVFAMFAVLLVTKAAYAEYDGAIVLPFTCNSYATVAELSALEFAGKEWTALHDKFCFKPPEGTFFKILRAEGQFLELKLMKASKGKLSDVGVFWGFKYHNWDKWIHKN